MNDKEAHGDLEYPITEYAKEIKMSKKPYKIICIKAYEIDGIKYNVGDIGHCMFGRPIMRPDLWKTWKEEQK